MNERPKENPESTRYSVKHFILTLFDIRGDMMSYEEIDVMMKENTDIQGSNMWILMLAILIASIGLNVNSTAVIIGAIPYLAESFLVTCVLFLNTILRLKMILSESSGYCFMFMDIWYFRAAEK